MHTEEAVGLTMMVLWIVMPEYTAFASALASESVVEKTVWLGGRSTPSLRRGLGDQGVWTRCRGSEEEG